jgi:sugar lactone lactonase YvrE
MNWQKDLARIICPTLIVLLLAARTMPREKLSVLVKGAPFHGANGIMFDNNDQLYVASVASRKIVVVDPETGRILNELGVNEGVEGPDDLVFGPDGSLYWTSILTGEVGRRTPDGVARSQLLAAGVNPITFSDDGRLFVALDFLGDALYELDPKLIEPPRLIAEDLGWMNGMDWGPDGYLYGPIWMKGQVVRVDVDSGIITTVADGFNTPAAVKFDTRGRLHVGDHYTGQVIRVDLENGRKEVIATGLSGLDNLAFDSQDRLFVSHAQDAAIFEALLDGTTRTVIPRGLIAAGGIAAVGPPDDESVFMADLFTLREFSGMTGEEKSLVRHFIGVPGLTSPFTIASDNNVMVLTSWFANSVQIWDPEIRAVVEEYNDFQVPINAMRFHGDLIVAELGTEAGAARVVRASSGQRVTLVDATNGLVVPSGLAASDNDLWVADWSTGKVLQVVDNGNFLSEPVTVAKGLSNPEGLVVEPSGNLLVVETGAGRVSLINPDTGNISSIVEGLKLGAPAIPSTPPTWIFSDIAVGSSGAVYITGDVENVLYRIEDHSLSLQE